MALPSFVSTRPQRRSRNVTQQRDSSSDEKVEPQNNGAIAPSDPSKSTIKAATRTRFAFSLVSSLLFLISLVFLILVEIGNVHATSRPVTGEIFFIKLDLSNIIPQSVPQARLINSIARTLGLHDFYQVGLWNYCDGYGDSITSCSKPRTLYWFNPVQIILSELLSGATIALPENIISALKLVRLASHWMFGLFLTAAPLLFLAFLLTPLIHPRSRWFTFPLTILTFLAALFVTVASTIATAMFIIFRNVVASAEESVNIVPKIGLKMFAFMWVSSACAIVGFLIVLGGCCCCASRRDIRTGRKQGRSAAWRRSGEVAPVEIKAAEKEKRKAQGGGGRRRWWSGRRQDHHGES